MLRQIEVRRDFIELHRLDPGRLVFAGRDHAILDGVVDLVVGDDRRTHAGGCKRPRPDRSALHAHLEALDIGQVPERPVGEYVADAAARIADQHNLGFGCDFVGDRRQNFLFDDQNILSPIADEVATKAEVVLIGYAGGGIRNIFANRPLRNLADIKGLKVRVQGAPIWSRTFAAAGMSPTVIAYNEVYNAIQNGVISAGENEAAGVEAMKFYEVGPNLSMTEHAITIRPICFSGKTFRGLPADLRAAILRAGKEAGAYGRQVESSEDTAKLVALEKAGKLKRITFTDRAQMKKLVDPVMEAYAKEIGADDIFAAINNTK